MTGFLHNLFNSVINARQRYAFTNTLTIVTFVAGSLGLVLCVKTGAGLRGVALVYVGQQAIAAAATVPLALRYMTRQGARFLPKREIKEIANYSFSVQLMGIIGLVNNQVGSLLVGGIFRLRAMAFYNAGTTLSSGLRNLTFNLLGPIGTHLTYSFATGGDEGSAQSFERLQRAWVIITTGISIVGVGAAYFAVVEWLGPQFSLGGEVATIGMVGDLVNLWTGTLTSYLAAVGRPDIEARYAIVAMLVNLRVVRKRYSTQTVSFLKEVPILPAMITLTVTLVLEKIAQPYAPQGALGLLFSGVPAAVGLLVFGFAVLGRRTGTFLRVLVKRPLQLSKLVELAFLA
jgi:O-antigen/teichoic acid export membrane protein